VISLRDEIGEGRDNEIPRPSPKLCPKCARRAEEILRLPNISQLPAHKKTDWKLAT
jgi:hypothetical protein